MKHLRSTVVLLVVLAVLGGAYAFVVKKGEKVDNGKAAGNAIKLLELDKEKINEITVENPDGKFVFTKKDGNWVLSSVPSFKIDTSKIEEIASTLASLEAQKVVSEDGSDLAQFGLDQPRTVTVKTSDGKEKTVELGNKTPTGDAYYLKEKDVGRVYTIDTSAGQTLGASKSDLKSKSLLPTNQFEDVSRFLVEKSGKTVFSALKTTGDSWDLVSPIEASVSSDSLRQLFSTAADQQIKEFVEDNPSDLDKYGLKNPAYSVEVQTAKGNAKLLIGSEKEKGAEVFAKFADSSEVFTIGEETIKYVDKPLKEMMDVFPFTTDISNVSRIEVEMDGKTVQCEVQADKEDTSKDSFKVDGKDASMKSSNGESYFRKYYQALTGIVMDDIETGAVPRGNPEITITYTLKTSPDTMKIQYISKDSNYYYVMRNGKYSGLTVSKKQFDKEGGVRETYKALTDAMNKKG
ncbi:MAG: DUF4340 domain-containing protein [Clostridiales bacterium]|jgi:hypothetical protein|nr:DUF4340 domain-containing protein [Eubacteriales bacterium]MDH7566441.1 DUF4340 domain-containing protein [Clostridiales bacterium]